MQNTGKFGTKINFQTQHIKEVIPDFF